MTAQAIIDDIRSGVATPDELRRFAAECMEAGTERSARTLYGAMRAFVWKALHGRRSIDELREWHDILRSVESGLSPRFGTVAAQIRVLQELIAELIAVAVTRSSDVVLRKKHVRTILGLLRGHASVPRREILDQMAMSQPNLMRILRLMIAAGLVEHRLENRKTILELTSKGRRAACSPAGNS